MITQLVFLLDFNDLKNHYAMIARNLSKQQALDADPKIYYISRSSRTNRNVFYYWQSKRNHFKTHNETHNGKKKNGTTEVTLKLWSNVAGDSKDENNFLHKLLLTNTQVSKFGKLLQMVYQLIWKYQKLNRIKQGNQEDFKVDF